MTLIPGGTAFVPTDQKLDDLKLLVDELYNWVEATMIPDVLAIAPYYADAFGYGKGPGRYIAWGVFEREDFKMSNRYLPSGVLDENLNLSEPDEKAIADLVGIYLTKEGFDVQIAYSGADAAKAILEQEFDLALLDVMLPDIDGFELLRTIRASHTYPVIMLTARDAQQDKIEGLSLGADDYVVKPFRPLELIARVHAQLRRYTSYGSRARATESPTLQLDGLEINRDARSVTVDGAPVRLTPIEYSILLYLAEHRGSVVPVEDLFRAVWNEDFMPGSNNTVMVHIRHLREKIGDDAQKPRFIKNVWGVGYIIE